MATSADASMPRVSPARTSRATDRALGVAAGIMALVVVVAVARGHAEWSRMPPALWVHLALIGTALVLTPVMLLRRQGTRSHRVLGYVWTLAMLLVAVTSLAFNASRGGRNWGVFSGDFSPIHLLSLVVLVMVPLAVVAARRHDVARHRRRIRGLVVGAILVAGFFTFPFHRLLGHWLFAG